MSVPVPDSLPRHPQTAYVRRSAGVRVDHSLAVDHSGTPGCPGGSASDWTRRETGRGHSAPMNGFRSLEEGAIRGKIDILKSFSSLTTRVPCGSFGDEQNVRPLQIWPEQLELRGTV